MFTSTEVPVSSRSLDCQLKSVSLRTNEEFVRLCNDVTETRHLYYQRLHDDQDFLVFSDFGPFRRMTDLRWKRFHDQIREVDQRLKRVERNDLFSEVLAGIMLQFEQKIFPVLREYRLCFEGLSSWVIDVTAVSLMIDQEFLLQDVVEALPERVCLESLESAHKVVVSALALLSFVYQYLIGCVDKGGSKSYSAGSFLFRLIFVAIVLFLGSYVWIKCRQASYSASRRKRKLADESDVPGRVYRRAVRDSKGVCTRFKYEPRFKPLREKSELGTTLKLNFLSLGSYNTHREAEIVLRIAAVLYGEVEGRPVQFEDGVCLPFPSVTGIENCPPSGKERAVWVTLKTEELYAQLLTEKKALLPPDVETDSRHGHDGEASRGDPSPSAPDAPSTAVEFLCFTSPHGGNGVVDQPGTSECHGLGQESLPDRELFSAFSPDCDIDQFISSMLQLEDNDFPAVDKVVGDCSETDRVFGCESTSAAPHSSAVNIPTPAAFASVPQHRVGDQGFKIIEPQLNSATTITFQQLESLPEQVQLQQHVTYQEERPKEFSGSNVELQQSLLESEERNSQLQQMLHQSKVENEKWRSMFRELAKLI